MRPGGIIVKAGSSEKNYLEEPLPEAGLSLDVLVWGELFDSDVLPDSDDLPLSDDLPPSDDFPSDDLPPSPELPLLDPDPPLRA